MKYPESISTCPQNAINKNTSNKEKCSYFRSHVADFLLEGGQEQSWLIGTKIVTITTSGGARVGSTGLCDKCLQFARRATEKVNNPAPEAATTGRKRHRTEAVRSR